MPHWCLILASEQDDHSMSNSACLAFNVHVHDELAVQSEVAGHELHDIFTMMSIIDHICSHVCTASVMSKIVSHEGGLCIILDGKRRFKRPCMCH